MNHFIKFPGLTLSAGRERRAEPGQREQPLLFNGSSESAPLWGQTLPISANSRVPWAGPFLVYLLLQGLVINHIFLWEAPKRARKLQDRHWHLQEWLQKGEELNLLGRNDDPTNLKGFFLQTFRKHFSYKHLGMLHLCSIFSYKPEGFVGPFSLPSGGQTFIFPSRFCNESHISPDKSAAHIKQEQWGPPKIAWIS